MAHLAGKLVEKIRAKQGSSLEITDRDVLCVKIAGLCHDLGRSLAIVKTNQIFMHLLFHRSWPLLPCLGWICSSWNDERIS